MEHVWEVGQTVAIDGKVAVKVDRVTASGRAAVGSEIYGRDGRQIGGSGRRRSSIEPMTPEIERAIELRRRGRDAAKAALALMHDATHWVIGLTGPFARDTEWAESDVQKLERLLDAVSTALADQDAARPPGVSPA